MNLVERNNGILEVIDHYSLYARSKLKPIWTPVTPGAEMVVRSETLVWYIDHKSWLGMTKEKYIRVATKGIAHYDDDSIRIGLCFNTRKNCETAIKNLSTYLFKRDYTDN